MLLDGVSWRGQPVPGDRVAALLAALAARPEGAQRRRADRPDLGRRRARQPDQGAPGAGVADPHGARRRTASSGTTAGTGSPYPPTTWTRCCCAGWLARPAAPSTPATRPAVDLASRPPALDVSEATPADGPLAELRLTQPTTGAASAGRSGLALAAAGRDQDAIALLEPCARRRRPRRRRPRRAAAQRRSHRRAGGGPGALRGVPRRPGRPARRRPGPVPPAAAPRAARRRQPVRDGVHFELDTLLGREDDLDNLRTAVRRSRLVSVVGPGGLGKTRVAHVLAREATQPRVYFVELVGVTSGDDVLAEVGAALGVRGSVTGRRTLSPAQLADVRSRIATELDAAPTLLVLDNCEHVLESVASLVALLLVTTRDLHVLTTSRAPLGLAAEQVVTLRQLAASRRCRAVRPTRPLRARRCRPAGRRSRRCRGPPRRAAAGHRAGRGPRAHHERRGGTPPARRPLRRCCEPATGRPPSGTAR